MSWRPRGSKPVVGSSKNNTFGLTISEAAKSSRRRIPPEYVVIGRFAASVKSKRSNNSLARSTDFWRPK